MRLEISLLGRPAVMRDGSPVPPARGNKSWAILAYVLLSAGPVSRTRLASLLFSDAEDPHAALRWNLNALRRLVGDAETFRGDPIEPGLPDNTSVDALVLRSGSWMDARTVAGLGNELLEGMSFGASPAFDAWLLAERRRCATHARSALREGALARLGEGDADAAAEYASQLVTMDPLDEAGQELFVRCLAAAGQESVARKQLDRALKLIRTELGVEPGADLLAACDHGRPIPGEAAPDRTGVRTRLEAGLAMVFAGQGAGIAELRRAVTEARSLREPELLLRTLIGFGVAEMHLNHGGGEESAAYLHEAAAIAERIGAPSRAARAHRILGFSEFWRGRYDAAEGWLSSAKALAGNDPTETLRIDEIRGGALTEVARYEDSIAILRRCSIEIDAERDTPSATLAYALLGRAHLLRNELGAAETALERSLGLAKGGFLVFAPWPKTMLAEVALRRGEAAEAAAGFEHAYSLARRHYGCECWESAAARGLALVSQGKGDLNGALRWLDIARTRPVRFTNGYHSIRAQVLETLCSIAVEHRLPGAPTWIDELEDHAARSGMREMLVRAYLLRGRLGNGDAMAAARGLAGDIDNPALHEELLVEA